MNETQITKFIKDNTMLGDCLSQKMTLYELKTLLIKYENEQLRLLGVGCSKPKKEELIYNVSDQHVYIEQMNKGRLQDIDRYLNLTQTVEDKTIG